MLNSRVLSKGVRISRRSRDRGSHDLDPSRGMLTLALNSRRRKKKLIRRGIIRIQAVGAGAAIPVLVEESATGATVDLRGQELVAGMFEGRDEGRSQRAVHVARGVLESAFLEIDGLFAALGGLHPCQC